MIQDIYPGTNMVANPQSHLDSRLKSLFADLNAISEFHGSTSSNSKYANLALYNLSKIKIEKTLVKNGFNPTIHMNQRQICELHATMNNPVNPPCPTMQQRNAARDRVSTCQTACQQHRSHNTNQANLVALQLAQAAQNAMHNIHQTFLRNEIFLKECEGLGIVFRQLAFTWPETLRATLHAILHQQTQIAALIEEFDPDAIFNIPLIAANPQVNSAYTLQLANLTTHLHILYNVQTHIGKLSTTEVASLNSMINDVSLFALDPNQSISDWNAHHFHEDMAALNNSPNAWSLTDKFKRQTTMFKLVPKEQLGGQDYHTRLYRSGGIIDEICAIPDQVARETRIRAEMTIMEQNNLHHFDTSGKRPTYIETRRLPGLPTGLIKSSLSTAAVDINAFTHTNSQNSLGQKVELHKAGSPEEPTCWRCSFKGHIQRYCPISNETCLELFNNGIVPKYIKKDENQLLISKSERDRSRSRERSVSNDRQRPNSTRYDHRRDTSRSSDRNRRSPSYDRNLRNDSEDRRKEPTPAKEPVKPSSIQERFKSSSVKFSTNCVTITETAPDVLTNLSSLSTSLQKVVLDSGTTGGVLNHDRTDTFDLQILHGQHAHMANSSKTTLKAKVKTHYPGFTKFYKVDSKKLFKILSSCWWSSR